MSVNTISKLFLTCAFALGAMAFSPPSDAQTGTRGQVRAIEQEYARQTDGRSISDAQLEYYLDRVNAGWSMSRISQDMVDARRMAPSNPWRAQEGWSASAVVCSSVDNRYRECAVPFRGRAVLNQQISQSACVEGQSWGQKPGLVWVNRGCRARFTMVPDQVGNAPGSRPSVVCKSQQGVRAVCNTGMDGRMQLISRFKNSGACIEGRTWGQRANQVWVSDNCRARFAAANNQRPNEGIGYDSRDQRADGDYRQDGDGDDGDDRNDRDYRDDGDYRQDRDDGRGGDRWMRDPGYSVVCSSSDSRQQRCNWDTRYGSPRLVQRTSQADCIEGRTWGYSERDGLWVGGGCRARFAAR